MNKSALSCLFAWSHFYGEPVSTPDQIRGRLSPENALRETPDGGADLSGAARARARTARARRRSCGRSTPASMTISTARPGAPSWTTTSRHRPPSRNRQKKRSCAGARPLLISGATYLAASARSFSDMPSRSHTSTRASASASIRASS